MLVSRNIIFFIVATIPVLFAAVQPWVWSFYTACIVLAFLILLWQNKDGRIWKPPGMFIFSAGLFFAVTLCQSLPLPGSVLSFLSPFRYRVLEQSRAIIGNPSDLATLSYDPPASLAWWVFLLGLFLFFLVFRKNFTSDRNLKILILILLAVAFLEAIYGLIQALVPSLGVLWIDYIKAYLGDARGTYINRNHFAGFMEMMLPLGLAYTLAMGNWQKKISFKALISSDRPNFQFFLSIGLIVMALALLLSKSRAGIFGGVLGFLTFALLMRSSSGELPRSFWVIISVIVGMVSFYSLKIGIDPVLERFLRIGKETTRLDIWRDSMAMVKDHPLGIGLAAFKRVFPVYNVSNFSDARFIYLHNDYLQLLVEAGWIGFTALVGGFYIFLVKSVFKIRRMRLQSDPLRFFLSVGALSGLVSIAFHSFFDFNLHMPANCVYFVMLMGIVYNCAWREEIGKGK
ncbi:MAG: O-antigen ligase family protein [Deltaproteobacteria bacterium]|nr:O-antigen ligase family protein [Deltaproteobacteria bacterium]